MERPLHPDAATILARLQKERVPVLYHFTSVENLLGICQMQALCSKKTLEDMGRWPPPVPGGNPLSHNLDRYKGNWNKVALNSIEYCLDAKGEDLCWASIDFEVSQ